MDWDLSPFFPAVDSAEYRAFFAELQRDAEQLLGRLEALGPFGEDGEAWRHALLEHEDLLAREEHLRCYLACLRAFDAQDRIAARAEADAERLGATLAKARVELVRGLGGADREAVDAWLRHPDLEGAGYYVERLRREARHSMGPALEGLAADLAPDGLQAWGRLYDDLAGSLTFTMRHPDGRSERHGMSKRRSLMRDPDRRVRHAAFVGGNEAWRGVSEVAAAALNHIAGTRLTLYERRGVPHFLDAALEQAAISRATLDAMLEAVEDAAELPRRFLRLKARLMGSDRIGWYDLEAPLPVSAAAAIPWGRGTALIRDAFARKYPALADYFERALERGWVEHSPREHKQSGAFCASSPLIEQSRVFMTYQGGMADVSTLAHEIGHGFHSALLDGARVLARGYPMTFAESASTFAELILSDGLVADERIDDVQRALLLGEALGDAASFLLDVPTRFRFEEAFYERRSAGELSVDEIDELMRATQRRTFGDALAEGHEDPLFWASKLHFFITELSFYNFPYTFGYLLSRGMRAMHAEQGEPFLERYEAFLRDSGSADAQVVAARTLGCDLEQPAFWREAIATLQPQLEELERVLARLGAGASSAS